MDEKACRLEREHILLLHLKFGTFAFLIQMGKPYDYSWTKNSYHCDADADWTLNYLFALVIALDATSFFH